ncbi:hypothetical protein HMPREF3230_00766 [Gardnerella vaginalis]|uniref:Uncharacterized protein n=1 Tax=Gardnerella vaginalis TaxID=2702 RepID=A0A135Z5V3_GARVA|nr:hypothetical protein HMPREF3230_00766 [Gardnerella vaginalis]
MIKYNFCHDMFLSSAGTCRTIRCEGCALTSPFPTSAGLTRTHYLSGPLKVLFVEP